MAVLKPSFDSDPTDFRVVALMATYSRTLFRGRCDISSSKGLTYTSSTTGPQWDLRASQEFIGRGVIGVERFPTAGPTNTYEWRSILARIETISETIETDWFMLQMQTSGGTDRGEVSD